MAVPHGPASVGQARRRLRRALGDQEIPEAVIDDAVLILSELLSNSCRYARPVPDELTEVGELAAGSENGAVLVGWHMRPEGMLTLEVTDGGAATRPLPASPSVTARGGRGLNIVGKLAQDWGVRHTPGRVTVWAQLDTYGGPLPGSAAPAPGQEG